MERKLRVLEVAGSMDVGGIENQLMHLIRKANRDQFQFEFTSDKPDAFYREEIERLGGKFILIPRMNWRNPIPYCRAMFKIMRDGQYDVVHSHELFHSGITLFLAFLAGVPCRFAHAHNWQDGNGSNRKRPWYRSVYNTVMRGMINRFSTVQIACSSWAGAFLYGEHTTQKSTYHLVYNSVDTSRFLPNSIVKNDSEQQGAKWCSVLNVARITEVKNQVFLTEIARVLKQRKRKIRFLCAGDGDESVVQTIREKIRVYELDEHILLLGVRKDIDHLMHSSDAFILPSRYEGMPLVMIEAQASGLPCLSADTYSHEVDFDIGQVEWLALESGADSWADAVEMVCKKEPASLTEIQQAIETKGFDSSRFAEKLCMLYKTDAGVRGIQND